MPKKARHRCTNAPTPAGTTTLPHTTASCFFSSFVSLSPSLCGAPLLHCSIFLKSLRTSIVSSCSKSSHRGSSVTDFFFFFFFFFFFSFFLSLSLYIYFLFIYLINLSIHTSFFSNPRYVIIASNKRFLMACKLGRITSTSSDSRIEANSNS
ncbi:hypothetical protein CI102_8858 [Trichoderma harzianum]|nr:hypothetical protein CI102_8858 [Trichoderma harzianum]